MVFSALMRKSSSASILTFVFILLVPMIVGTVIAISSGDVSSLDMWYLWDGAGSAITDTFRGPVENGPRAALVLILWGLVSMIAAYFIFRRRQV